MSRHGAGRLQKVAGSQPVSEIKFSGKFKFMKKVEFICDYCGNIGTKRSYDYNNNIANKKKNFCSRICGARFAGKSANSSGLNKQSTGRPSTEMCIFLQKARRFKVTNGIDFDITIQYLDELWRKQEGKCIYTGINLTIPKPWRGPTSFIYSASLDRIDSSKGYIQGNVQFVSKAINYMKNTMSDEDTKKLIKLVQSNGIEDQV